YCTMLEFCKSLLNYCTSLSITHFLLSESHSFVSIFNSIKTCLLLLFRSLTTVCCTLYCSMFGYL
ncbi:MAG: hypothetical protein ACK55Z_15900, partial [bacterium]